MRHHRVFVARASLLALAVLGSFGPSAMADPHVAMLDGQRVHYMTAGEGQTTIVMVHGWICTHEVWKHQMTGLEGRARLIAIDLPGHGQSDASEDVDYSMAHFARGIAAVMDDAGVDKAVLMGHSNGVPTIRQFHRMFPDRTTALIAVDGGLVPTLTREQAQPFIDRLTGDEYQDVVRGMFGSFLPPDIDPTMREEVIEMALATPKFVGLSSIAGGLEPEVLKEDPIEAPLLVVNAEAPFWTPEYEARVRAMAPHVDYRTMTGVLHFLQLQAPEEFNAHVIEFLDANDL